MRTTKMLRQILTKMVNLHLGDNNSSRVDSILDSQCNLLGHTLTLYSIHDFTVLKSQCSIGAPNQYRTKPTAFLCIV